jgi:hypothetical protein
VIGEIKDGLAEQLAAPYLGARSPAGLPLRNEAIVSKTAIGGKIWCKISQMPVWSAKPQLVRIWIGCTC